VPLQDSWLSQGGSVAGALFAALQTGMRSAAGMGWARYTASYQCCGLLKNCMPPTHSRGGWHRVAEPWGLGGVPTLQLGLLMPSQRVSPGGRALVLDSVSPRSCVALEAAYFGLHCRSVRHGMLSHAYYSWTAGRRHRADHSGNGHIATRHLLGTYLAT
jgi:hypothetical protein